MSTTITTTDIRQHHIEPSLAGGDFDQATIDAICEAILEAAPLSTWSYADLQYQTDVLDDDGYWAIVERVAEAQDTDR